MDLTGCTQTCGQYRTNLESTITKACSPDPGPSPSPLPSNCSDAGIRAGWGEIGQHCDAMNNYMTSAKWDLITGTVYSATATVCITACGLEMAGNPLAAGFIVACTLGDLSATGVDVAATSALQIEGNTVEHWWSDKFGDSSMALSLTGVGTGAGAILTKPRGGRNSIHPENSKPQNSKASKGLTCLTAGLMSTVAALKWENYLSHCDGSKTECDVAKKYINNIPPPIVTDDHQKNSDKSVNGNKPPSASNSSQSLSTAGGKTSGITSEIDRMGGGSFGGAMSAASSGGPLSDLVSKMPNLDQIPLGLKNLGTTLDALSKDYQAGGAGAAITAAAGGNLPDSIKSALSNLDRLAKEGKIKGFGEAPSILSSSGGGSGGQSSGSLFGFGSMSVSGALGGKGSQLDFDKKKSEPGLFEDGDIYHSNWNGNIFQIVSLKLGQVTKTRDRIDELEWTTPLNRALMGLPKESKEKPGSQTQKRK